MEHHKKVYAEADFSGTGRWNFENNVESFGRWIESTDAITDDEKDFLRNMDFSIRYDFCDYEMGCEVFYKATMENVHEKGTSLGSINVEYLSYEDIDITAQNLIDYACYSEDEVADMNMPREELKQWFFDNDSSENEQIEAVFDNDEAYRQLMQDERGTIFWPYDDNIDWDAYIAKQNKRRTRVRCVQQSWDSSRQAFPHGGGMQEIVRGERIPQYRHATEKRQGEIGIPLLFFFFRSPAKYGGNSLPFSW